MQLHEALSTSKSGAAQAKRDGKTIYCHSGTVLNISSIEAHLATGRAIPGNELGYGVHVQEDEQAPGPGETVEEMWEVEEMLKVNFGIAGLDWEPYEIEEV